MSRPSNKPKTDKTIQRKPADYNKVLAEVVELLEADDAPRPASLIR